MRTHEMVTLWESGVVNTCVYDGSVWEPSTVFIIPCGDELSMVASQRGRLDANDVVS